MIKNWRTTLFGILAFVSVNSASLGISPAYQKLAEGISIAALAAVSKDKNVTGVGANAMSEKDLKN